MQSVVTSYGFWKGSPSFLLSCILGLFITCWFHSCQVWGTFGNPGGGYIGRWTSGSWNQLMSDSFLRWLSTLSRIRLSWNLSSVHREAGLLPSIGLSPPLHANNSEFTLIALMSDSVLLVIGKTRHPAPLLLALSNRLISHNDFIIWVLKWGNFFKVLPSWLLM